MSTTPLVPGVGKYTLHLKHENLDLRPMIVPPDYWWVNQNGAWADDQPHAPPTGVEPTLRAGTQPHHAQANEQRDTEAVPPPHPRPYRQAGEDAPVCCRCHHHSPHVIEGTLGSGDGRVQASEREGGDKEVTEVGETAIENPGTSNI